MTAPRSTRCILPAWRGHGLQRQRERTGEVVDDARADQVIAAVYAGFERTEFPGGPFLQGNFDRCEPGKKSGRHDDRGLAARRARDARRSLLRAVVLFGRGLPVLHPCVIGGRPSRSAHDSRSCVPPDTRLQRLQLLDDGPRQAGDASERRRHPAQPPPVWCDDMGGQRPAPDVGVHPGRKVGAIVEYPTFRRVSDELGPEAIDAALDRFWRPRAESAPTADMLAAFLAKP